VLSELPGLIRQRHHESVRILSISNRDAARCSADRLIENRFPEIGEQVDQ
jgi:hypothetical protein